MTSPGEFMLPDARAREEIRTNLEVSMLVEASAGTGKTTSMVARLVEMIARGAAVESIAAITFTRKAAGELRGRFFAAMQKAAEGADDPSREAHFVAAMEKLDRCSIGTIHSFCGRLLREYPVQADVALNFREIEEADDLRLRREAWDDFVAETLTADGNDLPDRLEAVGLDFNQLRGPFTESYCEYPDVEHWPVDEVGYPDADSLAPCAAALREYVRHMRSMGDQLSLDATDDLIKRVFLRLPDSLHSVTQENPTELLGLLFELKGEYKKVNKWWPGGKEQAEAEHERWRDFYRSFVAPPVAEAMAARYRLAMEVFAAAVERYDRLRRRRGVLNFQDLLIKTRDLLRRDGEIRRRFQQDIRWLLVDEFQDTDPIQAEIMLLLTADDERCDNWRLCRPRPGALFVVGDPKQSIYRFRRADIQTYDFVRRRIADSGGRLLKLTANFRSSASVIDWVNEVFGNMLASETRRYQAEPEDMSPGRDAAEMATRADYDGVRLFDQPLKGKRNEDVIAADAAALAAMIREAIESERTIADFDAEGRAVLRPLRPGDFLILTASSAQLGSYASILQSAGLAVSVTGGGELNDRREIELLLRLVRAAAHPADPVALVACLRSELEGFSDADLLAFRRAGGRFDFHGPLPGDALAPDLLARYEAAFSRLRRCAALLGASLPTATVLHRLVEMTGLAMKWAIDGEPRPATAALWRLLALVGERAADGGTDRLCELLEEIVEGRVRYDVPALNAESDCVRLMNLHKAKGLEAPVVALAFPRGKRAHPATLHVARGERIEGHMCIADSVGPGGNASILVAQPLAWPQLQAEEQRYLDAEAARLLYVAATRAGRMLLISSNAGRYEKQDPWYPLSMQVAPTATVVTLPAPLPAEGAANWSAELMDGADERLARRRQAMLQPGYEVVSVRKLVLSEDMNLYADYEGDSLGPQWGSAVHGLLERAAAGPDVDLSAAAAELAVLHELPDGSSVELAATVEAVTRSALWQRARRARRMISEAPFEICEVDSDGSTPRIVSGVIDLAFEESDGWVIVDYKTDAAASDPARRERLVRHYAPQVETYGAYFTRITGQKVKETLLLFIH